MRKVIFIGRTGSGKTTLCQRLHQQQLSYCKTQAISFFDEAIDTPGEYLENRNYYSALMVTACDAQIIALVADPTDTHQYFPPGFAKAFNKPVIGIVTKIGLIEDQSSLLKAKNQLEQSGVKDIYFVDTVQGKGVDELQRALNKMAGA